MGIRFIITGANEDDFTDEQNESRELGCIFFATLLHTHDIMEDPVEGINLRYDGQHIEHRQSGSFPFVYHTYKFTPSNVVLELSNIEVNITCGGITISQFMTDGDIDGYIDHLIQFLADLILVQANAYKKNLQSVKEVGEAKKLPHNVEGRIGTFLSGKTGPLVSQENKLKQNMGISLAPKIKRKTRKSKGRKSA